MAHIKEPEGVDFVVDPTPITESERKRISEIIAYYKATGRKPGLKKSPPKAPKTNHLVSSLKHQH
jgi:hypothetical protein